MQVPMKTRNLKPSLPTMPRRRKPAGKPHQPPQRRHRPCCVRPCCRRACRRPSLPWISRSSVVEPA
eukprot:2783928-Pyramimonas_sp.AAC.1